MFKPIMRYTLAFALVATPLAAQNTGGDTVLADEELRELLEVIQGADTTSTADPNIRPNASVQASPEPVMPRRYKALQTEVINGDTLVLDKKFKVRLNHIDAPAEDDVCNTAHPNVTYNCGQDALQALDRAVSRHPYLICTGAEQIEGGWLANCAGGGSDLSAYMIRSGWADLVRGATSDRMLEQLADEARAVGRGLWKFRKTPSSE